MTRSIISRVVEKVVVWFVVTVAIVYSVRWLTDLIVPLLPGLIVAALVLIGLVGLVVFLFRRR